MTLSQITSVAPSTVGATGGFECKCSCGLVMRSSLLTALQVDVAQHIAYHERKGA